MRIDFGQGVYTGADRVRDVSGLVVNSGTLEVTRILVGHPGAAAPRLVDASAVASAEGDRVVLSMSRAEFEAMPELVSHEVATPPRTPEFPTILPASGVGGPLLADTAQTGPGVAGDSFFDLAPIDPPTLQVESNLLESEALLRHGSDVVSSDGHKVGTLDEVAFGDLEAVAGLVVRAGFLFHHDLRLPISAVAEFGTDKVYLNVTKDEAERRRA